jgi:large subunit ribosomal protein L12e
VIACISYKPQSSTRPERQAHKSFAKNLAGGVKEVLGTCQSVGCTVDGKPPHDIIEAIDEGEIVVPDE